MKTVTELLAERADRVTRLVDELLAHSSVCPRNLRPGGGLVIVTGKHFRWAPLGPDGRRVQSQALAEYERYSQLLHVLLRGQPDRALQALKKADGRLTAILQQSGATGIETVEEARARAHEAIATQLGLVGDLYDASDGTAVFVPDTNALIYNPQLDEWTFEGAPRFVVLLVSNVVAELDQLKVNHRNEEVRRKAEGVIGRIKSYRERGDLLYGVPLRKGVSLVRATAIEPRVEGSLPWLDPQNRDDRVLASLVEIVREHPRSPVALVTRELNLQHKAMLAGLPFVEPPDPPAVHDSESQLTRTQSPSAPS